ncbi:LysR family transcriptional regulator [Patulibacter sp. NPDC049589]|uniref:LysR family transcriptional regulator n=1 Tax=Patulibacter sp. NPDC049589 TaxID=3154731 RepID=UPI00344516D7
MDLRQLRYFLAVVEEQGFRRASRALFVAQPAVSRALRQLEQELGVELFNRSALGVELTDAGVEFVALAQTVLRSADEARDAMRGHAVRGTLLRVGAGPLCAGELTTPILRLFGDAHSELDVAVEAISFCDQTSPILDGTLDVAIVRGPLEHPDLEVTPIAAEPRALLVGLTHELADQESVDVGDVLVDPTVPLQAPADWAPFWQLDDVRGRSNNRADAAPATSLRAMRQSVADGATVITVPDAMRRIAPNPTTRCIGLRGAEPSTIAVARRRRDRRTAVLEFVEQAAETAERNIHLLPGAEVVR